MSKQKYTNKQLHSLYSLWTSYNSGRLNKKTVIELSVEDGWNESSANMLVGSLDQMIEGELYKRIISTPYINILLPLILKDFGKEITLKCCHAIQENAHYYATSSTVAKELPQTFDVARKFASGLK